MNKEDLQRKLSNLEAEMNSVYAELAKRDEEEDLSYNDVIEALKQNDDGSAMEDGEFQEPEEADENGEFVDETTAFLGENPANQDPNILDIREDVAQRINVWVKKGFSPKEERERLLKSIPRKGLVYLEAPALNEEIASLLQRKPRTKDDHFRSYQNLAGAALSANATALSCILSTAELFSEREKLLTWLSNSTKLLSDLFYQLTQVRKMFLCGHFEEDIQKTLKKIEPTEWLFGDNLRASLENVKAVERVTKDLKPKNRLPLKNVNLNSSNSPAQREVPRSSQGSSHSRQGTSRTQRNRDKPYPARKHYSQTQPHQRSSRR